ncbi:Putative SOS response-associated peptidase YedK [Pseudomonas sp. NFIX10]|uniref:SOS response-associated peptidase family protein n=1 Tax=unclassified Pseudomonas TaxID=196821 RepID=UPI0008EA5870|nr:MULTISPECIES: SOS response-associated peptidase family protein [unclassified Pseudomonas]SFB12527.1 Putative SOS response-associated peptidase YedK [Pseudomonas sp. NFIX10]SFE66892.1 Putative SOS response-associated peptidase YedK [Pseudomonas sp. NFACC06-1]
MCDGLVQHGSSKDSLAYFAQRDTHGSRFGTRVTPLDLYVTTPPKAQERHSLIKPNMQVSAIRRRRGHLECIKVRWGWSPIWSVGTMPPLTHLPLHLVMRSKVFDSIKHEGRVLVAVEGWYEAQAPASPSQAQRLIYTTTRQSTPIFLAALAQASETPFGCDGLALVTYGDIANQQQRVLAFSAEDALDWLEPELGWEQAQQLAARLNGAQPALEPALTAQRPAQGGL